jgi:hypothetical protein
MLTEIPADWTDRENAKNGVKDQTPLNGWVKWSEGYRNAGKEFEEKNGGDPARQERGPT